MQFVGELSSLLIRYLDLKLVASRRRSRHQYCQRPKSRRGRRLAELDIDFCSIKKPFFDVVASLLSKFNLPGCGFLTKRSCVLSYWQQQYFLDLIINLERLRVPYKKKLCVKLLAAAILFGPYHKSRTFPFLASLIEIVLRYLSSSK
ncbi:unnamed protein product, partial [Cuscuta epithymum]